jgi:hypothetical protein
VDVFEIDGRLIQLDTSSDIGEEGMVIECWDISPGVGQGLLFSIVERSGGLVVRPEMTEIPVGLLQRVLAEIGHED